MANEDLAARARQLAALAAARRVARVRYKRPGAADAAAASAEFLVEPYHLHRSPAGVVLHAWQLAPVPADGRPAWRDFRLSRMTDVADGGQSFAPRAPVTLPDDAAAAAATAAPAVPAPVWGDQPIVAVGPADEYHRALEAAMLDGQVTPEELATAEALGGRVEPHERKAVHARVFASVLDEVVQDGRISHREELYLGQVRELLGRLGWAP